MFRTLTLAILLITFPLLTGTAEALMTSHTLESPNKDFKVVVYIGPINDVSFAVFYKEEMIVNAWTMAFEVDEDDQLPATVSFTLRHLRDGGDGPVPLPSKYKASTISSSTGQSARNAEGQADYNEYTVGYDGVANIVFRAYDDGIAYRYEIATKAGETITIKNELTEFSFPNDYAVEGSAASLSKIGSEHPSPLLIKIPHVPALSFGEVSDADFAALRFKPGHQWGENTFNNLYDRHGNIDRTGKVTSIALNLDGETAIPGNGALYRTPWRYMKFGSSDAEGMLKSLNALPAGFRHQFTFAMPYVR